MVIFHSYVNVYQRVYGLTGDSMAFTTQLYRDRSPPRIRWFGIGDNSGNEEIPP